MTALKKVLLAGACAGLFAFSAAPVLAAGPAMTPAKNDLVQSVEYRYDPYSRRWVWHEPPRYYSPRSGRDSWRDRDDNPPGPRGGPGTNWENPPGPRGGPGASPDRRYPTHWYTPIY